MSQQNLLFIIFGVILIGIAFLTDYVSTNNSPAWKIANKDLPVKIDQAVVISGNNFFAGTYDDGVSIRL